jgi:8-oxo-dGTP pyrophosphatase MutT (NUDIX family)
VRPIEAAEPADARPAATVILMRRGGRHTDRGLELLMLRRGDAARFMPGVWVFAGGVVEEADRQGAGSIEVPDDADADEIAHRVCGARELAEEAGVEVDPAGLIPWSRWITPEEVPLRFDTRFYVGLAPPHSAPRPDEVEMDEARWLAPQAALDAQAAGELEISFPTVRHLEMLVPHADAEAVLAAAREREVEPILPKVIGDRDSFEVLLPGDPRYPG